MIPDVPIEVIIFLIITLLSLIGRVLKFATNNNALEHIKKRIKKSKEKAESILSESLKEQPLINSNKNENLQEMIEHLVDLSEDLIFNYSPRK